MTAAAVLQLSLQQQAFRDDKKTQSLKHTISPASGLTVNMAGIKLKG